MKRYKKIKKLSDGRTMLNIGCGVRMHPQWNNLDFSPYARLAHYKLFTKFLKTIRLLSEFRFNNLHSIDPEIIRWDVCRGLPFDDNSFDAIYHSHFITHLDRDAALFVTRECHRILKKGGVFRVVVPDLWQIIQLYNNAVEELEKGRPQAIAKHSQAVEELFELMVRKKAFGTSRQNSVVRLIERIIRGDINKTGELRRWHYDKYSMGKLIRDAGFKKICVMNACASNIRGWTNFGLDLNRDGSIYKPSSLYMEGFKD